MHYAKKCPHKDRITKLFVCEYPPMEYENHNYEESRQDIGQNPHQAVFMGSLQRQIV